jgi:hypothetical protein
MLIVWKFDLKLATAVRIAESVSLIIAGRNLRVTNRADGWAGAFEELRPMATHTSIMIRIVSDVRIVGYFVPVSRWYFMTGYTISLMMLCRMKKPGVIDARLHRRAGNGNATPVSLGGYVIATG